MILYQLNHNLIITSVNNYAILAKLPGLTWNKQIRCQATSFFQQTYISCLYKYSFPKMFDSNSGNFKFL